MVVGFGGIELAVAAFPLERDEDQHFPAGLEQALQFLKGRKRIGHMFQGMVAKDGINARGRHGHGVRKEFDTTLANVVRQKSGDVTADFSGALEAREIPARPDPEFKHDVG